MAEIQTYAWIEAAQTPLCCEFHMKKYYRYILLVVWKIYYPKLWITFGSKICDSHEVLGWRQWISALGMFWISNTQTYLKYERFILFSSLRVLSNILGFVFVTLVLKVNRIFFFKIWHDSHTGIIDGEHILCNVQIQYRTIKDAVLVCV